MLDIILFMLLGTGCLLPIAVDANKQVSNKYHMYIY